MIQIKSLSEEQPKKPWDIVVPSSYYSMSEITIELLARMTIKKYDKLNLFYLGDKGIDKAKEIKERLKND